MKTIITILLMTFALPAYADGFSSEAETRTFADKLMKQFEAEKFDEAMKTAKPYWPIPEAEIDVLLSQIKQQWGSIIKTRFGETTGTEYVTTKKISQSFARYIYLHKFNNHAIYWEITFYKPGDEWKINSIKYADQLEQLYE